VVASLSTVVAGTAEQALALLQRQRRAIGFLRRVAQRLPWLARLKRYVEKILVTK